jgi:hypothetical protein
MDIVPIEGDIVPIEMDIVHFEMKIVSIEMEIGSIEMKIVSIEVDIVSIEMKIVSIEVDIVHFEMDIVHFDGDDLRIDSFAGARLPRVPASRPMAAVPPGGCVRRLRGTSARASYIEMSFSGRIPVGEMVTFRRRRAWITVDWP